MKKLLFSRRNDAGHWVGDGFPVRSIFTYNDIAKDISPFLLMDYAGPWQFEPAKKLRGVGEHPHRGFETVTIVYSGELEHRDSSGGGGKIGPGDVQWMTAASGLVHQEFHSQEFSNRGGILESIQLWVNLPAKDKMTKPRYQGINKEVIPVVQLPNAAGSLRVIAGSFDGKTGAAKVFSPIALWDVQLKAGKTANFKMPVGHTCLVFLMSGTAKLGSGENLVVAELAALDTEQEDFTLTAAEDAKLMILGGQPLNEPIVGYGPFVMNSRAEIQQAMIDFESGKMGTITPIENA